jgi:hypothetical protein
LSQLAHHLHVSQVVQSVRDQHFVGLRHLVIEQIRASLISYQ